MTIPTILTAPFLSGVSSIARGKSVIFIELAAGGNANALTTSFINTWLGGSAPAGFLIGTYTLDGTGSTNHDTEGLTYLGNGVVVVGEERLFDAYRFTYVPGTTVTLANSYVSIGNENVGNNGMEGISYDPRGAGSFVAIKQQSPENILAGTLTFAGGAGGTSTMSQLFDPTLMGLDSLSDVQTLSPVDALTGTPAADNLLVLSLASRRLVEVTRAGMVLSSFNLTNVLAHNAIEGRNG